MNSSVPRVSVVMPAFNRQEYVADAIESVLQQDFPDVELIVVDDGSTDGTTGILEGFGERILLLRQERAGPGAARNLAIERSRGTYIAFLDSDDLWVPGKVRAQVEHLEANPGIGAVFGEWTRWSPDASGVFHRPPCDPVGRPEVASWPKDWIYADLLLDCWMLTSTVMIRRNVVEQVGPFDATLLRGQDYDYWLRLSRVARIHKLDAIIAHYREHTGTIVNVYPGRNYEYEVVQRAYQRWGLKGADGREVPLARFNRRLYDSCVRFGHHHLKNGDPAVARASFAQALRHRSFAPRCYAYWLLATAKSLVTRVGGID